VERSVVRLLRRGSLQHFERLLLKSVCGEAGVEAQL
jgi:hypothetical protein